MVVLLSAAWPVWGWQQATSDHGVPLRWPKPPPMPVLMDPVPGVADGGAAALAAAVSAWTAPDCTGLTFGEPELAGLATPTNAVTVAATPWPHEPGDAAFTVVDSNGPDGAIRGARIELNGVVRWADYGSADAVDLQGLLVHEIGHMLGLGHSRIREATLYPGIRPGSVRGRTLNADDLAALCTIYPAEPPPSEGSPWLLLLGPLGLLLGLVLAWRVLRGG